MLQFAKINKGGGEYASKIEERAFNQDVIQLLISSTNVASGREINENE